MPVTTLCWKFESVYLELFQEALITALPSFGIEAASGAEGSNTQADAECQSCCITGAVGVHIKF